MILDYLFNQDLESAAEQYGISNTDPIRSSSAKSVTVSKSHYFRAPGMTFAEAQADTQNVKTPLVRLFLPQCSPGVLPTMQQLFKPYTLNKN